MQVYRRMDIGTAKPTRQDRAEVAHHCIDLVEPDHDFTVAQFKAAHAAALGDIGRAGGRALLVGGTGLYHRVVVDDFDLPGEWPAIREELDGQPDTQALDVRRRVGVDPGAERAERPAAAERHLEGPDDATAVRRSILDAAVGSSDSRRS